MTRTRGPEHQSKLAAAAAAYWKSREWPPQLLSFSFFTSSHGDTALSYAQWSSETALRHFLDDQDDSVREDTTLGLAAKTAGDPKPFRLYRVVRGTAIGDQGSVPECFPVAFFAMPDLDSARRWIDDMLAAEEETEGSERSYPGAVSANFHISLEGTEVMVISEWLSETQASAHVEAVWEPLLAAAGENNTGGLYRRAITMVNPAG